MRWNMENFYHSIPFRCCRFSIIHLVSVMYICVFVYVLCVVYC